MKKSLLILFSLIAFNFTALAQEPAEELADLESPDEIFSSPDLNISGEHKQFAACTGVLDSIPVTLEFFEETKNSGPEKNGYFIQTIGTSTGENMKMKGRSTFAIAKDGKSKAVSMYVVIEPSALFSTFEIDLTKKSEVEIYSAAFRALWGKFTCTPKAL